MERLQYFLCMPVLSCFRQGKPAIAAKAAECHGSEAPQASIVPSAGWAAVWAA